MDALRSHEYQCGGSMLGRHFRFVYQNTTKDSKLRYYCSTATACFLSKHGEELPASISELFAMFPDFKRDVCVAKATFPDNTLAHDPDSQTDDNPFGPCEFHTHRQGDICHAYARSGQGCRLYIGNIADFVTKDDLRTFLKDYRV
jgi:hypothetical protein